jgi:hypothetical protein
MAGLKSYVLASPSDPATKNSPSNARTLTLASEFSAFIQRNRRSLETLEKRSNGGYIMSDRQEPAYPSGNAF